MSSLHREKKAALHGGGIIIMSMEMSSSLPLSFFIHITTHAHLYKTFFSQQCDLREMKMTFMLRVNNRMKIIEKYEGGSFVS